MRVDAFSKYDERHIDTTRRRSEPVSDDIKRRKEPMT